MNRSKRTLLAAGVTALVALAVGLAVIGVVTARDRNAAIEVARRLLEVNPGLVVAPAGRAAQAAPGVPCSWK